MPRVACARYRDLAMRIATFNVQRLRLRQVSGSPVLGGARDSDDPRDRGKQTPIIDAIDRRLTARVLAELDADVVALTELFDQATLDHFHDAWLLPAGASPYPHRVCLPGNDGRGFDVALMSRQPLADVASHAQLTSRDLDLPPDPAIAPDTPIFRRDCLQARVGALTLFVCHFKAPYPDIKRARRIRRIEALAVRRIIERHFAGDSQALWLVLGDLNEHHPPKASSLSTPEIASGADQESALLPLTDGFAVDLGARMAPDERWSYRDPATGRYSRPDALLASPALAARVPDAVPFLVKSGLEQEITRYTGPRLAGVGEHRPHASDHAALAIDLPGL